MDVKETIAYLSDIKEATGLPPGAVAGNVVVFGDGAFVDSGKKISDFQDAQQTETQIENAITEHANSDGHVTVADRTQWNGKQDEISDIAQIRANAHAGAGVQAALQQHEDNTAIHVTAEEKDVWNAKQEAIDDLGAIRANAEKGAEAFGRDELSIESNKATAVSSATAITSIATYSTSGDSETIPQARGFKMNLRAYVKHGNATDYIREVCFNSIGLYLSGPNALAKLAIYKAGESEPVVESDPISLVSAQSEIFGMQGRPALNSFGFSEQVWLKADCEYEFKIVRAEAGDYIQNLTLELSSSLVVEGFKVYWGGSYSPYAGCFKGEAAVQIKSSSQFELAKKSDIPTKTSELTNDSGFVDGSALESKADKTDVEQLAEDVESAKFQQQADWAQSDNTKSDYIKNKPNIPTALTVDTTLSVQGAAADAKAVGDALAGLESHYAFVTLIPTVNDHVRRYKLVDRAVNYIAIDVAYGDRVVVDAPDYYTADGTDRACECVVVFSVATESDLVDEIRVECSGNVVNYAGVEAEVVAAVGSLTAFRFLEIDRSSNRYLVTGASDPAYTAIRQIEKALDDVLADGGLSELTTPFKPGVYFYNEDTGKYHKVAIRGGTQDDDEVNIGVEQEGVQK